MTGWARLLELHGLGVMHIRTKGLRQLLNLLILSVRHGRCSLACIKSNVKAILIEEHLYSASANVSKSERADTRYVHPKCETMKMTLIDSFHSVVPRRLVDTLANSPRSLCMLGRSSLLMHSLNTPKLRIPILPITTLATLKAYQIRDRCNRWLTTLG
jgi:hypothetical protein